MTQVPAKVAILRNIKEHLQGITPANGYSFDLSAEGSVIIGRPFIDEQEGFPKVSIIEPPLPVERLGFYTHEARGPRTFGPWRLIFQCWTYDDKGSYRESEPAYTLAAEVLKRMMEEKTRPKKFPHDPKNYFGSGKTIDDFKLILDAVRPPDEYSRYSIGWIMIDFDLIQNYVDQWVDID
jgi:hypothetical protein